MDASKLTITQEADGTWQVMNGIRAIKHPCNQRRGVGDGSIGIRVEELREPWPQWQSAGDRNFTDTSYLGRQTGCRREGPIPIRCVIATEIADDLEAPLEQLRRLRRGFKAMHKHEGALTGGVSSGAAKSGQSRNKWGK